MNKINKQQSPTCLPNNQILKIPTFLLNQTKIRNTKTFLLPILISTYSINKPPNKTVKY